MAITDKNILITPNIGQAAEPKIDFVGASATLGPQTITLNVYPENNGTISFEGSAGQLFSVTNDLTGTIFSVNDVSGIPSIEVLASGVVRLAEYSGNVLVGTATDNGTDKLQISGDVSATTFKGALSGNATTATTLQTTRAINGTNFDGSAAITTANWGTARTISIGGTGKSVNGSANITWATSEIAAQTAVTLATTRAINGTNFNGSAAITTANWGTARTINGTSINGSTDYTTANWGTARDINGTSVNGSANYAIGRIYDTNYRRITNPGGGESVNNAATTTGAIAVTLPVGVTNTMVRMTIKIYEYTSNESFEVHVGGYNYSGGSWANSPFAYIIANPGTDRRFTVRLGYNATTAKFIVYIGELASTWSYPQVYVTEVMCGHSGQQVAWTTGWAVGFEATAFQSVTATISNSQVGYAVSANTANSTVLRDSSGNFSAGTITAALSGNATTATTLQTARTIGGVSFNGSANINLPGVNTAGNQNTSGNAATATALQTARTINGVSFNGTANITVADGTKLPLAGGSLTGTLTLTGNATSIRQNSTTTWSGDAPSGVGKLEYHSNRWYINAGGDSVLIAQFRRGGADIVNISNAGVYSGSIAGNAATATTLQTTRAINGTNFNGSAAITTANWGTARTLTIGSTGKSVNGSGNVAWSLGEIGALPTAGGTITGIVNVSTGGNIIWADSNGTYIPRPQGATFKTSSSAFTGALSILMPTAAGAAVNDMMSFWVDIYDYAGGTEGESVSIYVYGYLTGTRSWAHSGATVFSDRTDRDYTVRFGENGTVPVVCIGEINSSWSYPQVIVRDFQAGYTAAGSTYDDGWSITFLTTLPTISQTSTANYPVAKSASTWTTARTLTLGGVLSGSVAFDGSANFTLTAAHTSDPVITLTGAVTGSGTMTNLGSVSIATTATADPTLTLAGDATGSATFTNLGNATLTVAIVDDSHSHAFNNLTAKTGGTGTYQTSGDFRAPIFYDSNNTAYYADLAGVTTSVNQLGNTVYNQYGRGPTGLYSASRLQLLFSMGAAYQLPADGSTSGNLYGVAWSHPNAGTIGGANNLASHGMLMIENGVFKGAWGGGSLRTPTDARAPIFYDYNDTTYYCDPNSTTHLNDARANIFYQRDDVNNRWDSGLFVLRSTSPTIYFRDIDGNSAHLHNNSNLFYLLRGANDSETSVSVNGQWPVYWNLTNNAQVSGGTISAVGDITAYSSDRRLKENIKPIENSLEKLLQLTGVTYDWKDCVDELGFTPTIRKNDAGLIAQEVQAVLPQAVAPAPFDQEWDNDSGVNKSKSGEDYLTVQYEKLVPLLVEAIKELNEKIIRLESGKGNV
jgi:hypothetical protein